MLEEYLPVQLRRLNLADPRQIVETLSKVDFDDNDFWISDGLVFAQISSDYCEGVNPYILQWKDTKCSFFVPQASHNGSILANLRLTESYEFQTLDEQIVTMTESCYYESIDNLSQYRPNRIYQMQTWVNETITNSVSVGGASDDENQAMEGDNVVENHNLDKHRLYMTQFKITKPSYKAFPDWVSRLVFSQREQVGQKITAEAFLKCLRSS